MIGDKEFTKSSQDLSGTAESGKMLTDHDHEGQDCSNFELQRQLTCEEDLLLDLEQDQELPLSKTPKIDPFDQLHCLDQSEKSGDYKLLTLSTMPTEDSSFKNLAKNSEHFMTDLSVPKLFEIQKINSNSLTELKRVTRTKKQITKKKEPKNACTSKRVLQLNRTGSHQQQCEKSV